MSPRLTPTIARTAGQVYAKIIGLVDSKHGTAANRNGPCRTACASLIEGISWHLLPVLRYHHECNKGAERHAAVVWAPPQQTGKPITEQGLDAAPNVEPKAFASRKFPLQRRTPRRSIINRASRKQGLAPRARAVGRAASRAPWPCSTAAAIVLSTVPAVPVSSGPSMAAGWLSFIATGPLSSGRRMARAAFSTAGVLMWGISGRPGSEPEDGPPKGDGPYRAA
jgi:hypothetical protein